MIPAPVLPLVLAIVGGAPSLSPSEDAVVCLSADGFPYCTGVLVGPRSVLTAGHCIDTLGAQVTYRVNLGPDCNAPTLRMATVRRLTHPQFSGQGKPFDVGYISLAEDAPVPPLALADGALETHTAVGTSIRHVGYGGTDEGSQLSGMGTRRTVVHSLLRLEEDFAWSGDGVSNTCLMDSGGPMLTEGNGAPAVLALVSDGPSCREPGADVRLDRVRAWVDEQVHSESPEPEPTKPGGCTTAPGASGLFTSWALWRAWGATRRSNRPTMAPTPPPARARRRCRPESLPCCPLHAP